MGDILTTALVGISTLGMAIVTGTRNKEPRFPEIKRDQMNDAQKRVYDEIATSRGGVRGPFGVLLRSPDLADRWQRLGEYVRFKTSLPPRLNEFAILITARFWGSKYEWFAHRPLAIKAGLTESIAEDLAQNKRPANMRPDEELVYEFCTTLHRQHFVGDPLFKSAMETLGERGVIDLVAVSGFYVAVSMVLNVAEIAIPPGEKSPW
ncbi:MAG TPA: carboxymuconolactone decarboxylase family protein [Thermodesulfobacteriota bacterium]|nr:carboxymuconolactone decarboxylase family protein [Thermodesulfobacteriota bacterium]